MRPILILARPYKCPWAAGVERITLGFLQVVRPVDGYLM